MKTGGFYITFYPAYVRSPVDVCSTSDIIKEMFEDRGGQMPGAKSPGNLSFVFWCLLSLDPQCGPCINWASWRLEFVLLDICEVSSPRSEEQDVLKNSVDIQFTKRLSAFMLIEDA